MLQTINTWISRRGIPYPDLYTWYRRIFSVDVCRPAAIFTMQVYVGDWLSFNIKVWARENAVSQHTALLHNSENETTTWTISSFNQVQTHYHRWYIIYGRVYCEMQGGWINTVHCFYDTRCVRLFIIIEFGACGAHSSWAPNFAFSPWVRYVFFLFCSVCHFVHECWIFPLCLPFLFVDSIQEWFCHST